MKITIIGTGYVGLVTGTCLAEVGHEVTCVDISEEKITLLKRGKSPIYEPGLEKLIHQNIAHERLFFSTSLEGALSNSRIAFIAVGTPEGEDGSADLSYVITCATQIGRFIEREIVVVVKSTVPVGTCDLVEETINKELLARGKNFKVCVVSNPEFLKEGEAVNDFMRPDRIIIGLKEEMGIEIMQEIYRPFIIDDPGKLLVIDRRSSELSKYAANSMLATRISFMNEMSRLCEKVGANIDSVRRGMGSDPRIGKKFLYAGPGYGGSCFPKDVEAMIKTADRFGEDLHILKSVSKANLVQKQSLTKKIRERFPDLSQKTIAVWGLSFKPGTDDVRESPAKIVIGNLLDAGAKVRAHDPEAMEKFAGEFGNHKNLQYAKNSYSALENANALVLLTEWLEYRRPNWEKISKLVAEKVVFDFRNQYDGERLRDLGYFYRCIGRPDSIAKQDNPQGLDG